MNRERWAGFIIVACLILAPTAIVGIEPAEKLKLKPGFNLFSKQQDIDAGKQAAAYADKQLPLVNDPQVLGYLNNLGHRMTQYEPLPADYPWIFKVVNTKDINAFALPGGYIYVNRGTIESAENEAQLAGVVAHETGHVVMRHGTHQASQIMLTQAPLAILGGMLGQGGSLVGQLAQMGIGFGVTAVLHLRSAGLIDWIPADLGVFVAVVFFIACVCVMAEPYCR
jgi:predicted Zn-dependent protease